MHMPTNKENIEVHLPLPCPDLTSHPAALLLLRYQLHSVVVEFKNPLQSTTSSSEV